MSEKRADAVFEGGGVKGIGLIGAAAVIENAGYRWGNVAGTSAGAIVASLIAAGYSALELQKLVGSLDYRKFKDPTALDRLPLLGPLLNLVVKRGIYAGDYLETWIGGLLKAKGISTFKDLLVPGETDPRYRYKLNVITSDVTGGLLVVLPQGAARYGVSPDDLSVAAAVRMSMSIPFFFEAVKFQSAYFVDGGILSNFPVWLFDSPTAPPWPTFGFKFIEPDEGKPNDTSNPIALGMAIISTMMEAHDKYHIENEDFLRTIVIPTLGVSATDFGLGADKAAALFESGTNAAKTFLSTWDFGAYVKKYRVKRDPKYVAKVSRLKRNMVGAGAAVSGTANGDRSRE